MKKYIAILALAGLMAGCAAFDKQVDSAEAGVHSAFGFVRNVSGQVQRLTSNTVASATGTVQAAAP